MKFYDAQKQRLIFIRQEADAKYWDDAWKARLKTHKSASSKPSKSFVEKITLQYLKPQDGPILEGGCGRGHYVQALNLLGYQCIGVDYAESTIRDIKESNPDLDVRQADVRKLPFADDYFAGYWSVGVIEHFWEGYGEIAREMKRVLKSGGYLFLTFPQMSLMRKLKAQMSIYKRRSEPEKPEGFYQFALNPNQVAKHFENLGFKEIEIRRKDALKGLKDELILLKPILQWLYDYRGRNFFVRGVRKVIEIVFSPIAGHSALVTLRLTKKS